MAAHIDRRLIKKIGAAGEADQIEAIFVVKEAADAGKSEDQGLLKQTIEGASGRAGDLPSAVRYFPRANAVVITARSKLIQEVLQDESLAVANAVDFDLMDFIFA